MADDRAMRLYFDIIDFFFFRFAWCLMVVGVISRMESGSDESILFTLVFFPSLVVAVVGTQTRASFESTE